MATQQSQTRLRAGLKTIVKLAITITIFAVIASMVDLDALIEIGRRANIPLLLMVPLLGIPLIALDSLRWTYVMAGLGQHLSLTIACRYSLVGLFFSNLAPGFLGFDGFRAIQMKRLNVPLEQALQSVLFDRLSAFASLMMMILVLSPYTFTLIDNVAFLGASAIVITGGVAAFLCAILIHVFRDRLDMLFSHKAFKHLTAQVAAFVSLFTKPSIALPILASGLAVHLARSGLVFAIALALSIDVSLLNCIALIPLALLMAMIPISFGDWGVREAVFVFALANIGFTAEEALATSICYGLYRLIVGGLGGLAFLAFKREHFALNTAA